MNEIPLPNWILTSPVRPEERAPCASRRAAALKKFSTRGFPSRREEAWKYTDISHLAKNNYIAATVTETAATLPSFSPITLVFVNGHFSAALSHLAALPKEVTLLPLNEARDAAEPYLSHEYDEKRFPFAVLNTALMNNGFFLRIAANCAVTTPIHCLFVHTQNNLITCPRNIIVAEENSCVTIIEEHIGYQAENYFVAPVTQIVSEKNAGVNYYKIQAEALSATHIANVFIEQQQDSRVKTFFFSHGSRLEREDVSVWQKAQGAEVKLTGFYAPHADEQVIDHHVHVDHLAAHGTSSMTYKGILDKKSRAVFNGKVFVHKNAQQINAHQENHNLLLSPHAEINTKPELEIYADDIKCTHGATIGQLDQEALFYLRSRGVDEKAARQLLIHAFSDQVLNNIENRDVRHYIQQRVMSHDEL